jgi:hypothetical protein
MKINNTNSIFTQKEKFTPLSTVKRIKNNHKSAIYAKTNLPKPFPYLILSEETFQTANNNVIINRIFTFLQKF